MGRKERRSPTSNLWLKAFLPPTSDCYNARERHTTIVSGPNLNVRSPPLILHFNHWEEGNGEREGRGYAPTDVVKSRQ